MQRGHGRVLVGREPVVDGGRYGYAGQVRKARQRMVDDLHDAGNRLPRSSTSRRMKSRNQRRSGDTGEMKTKARKRVDTAREAAHQGGSSQDRRRAKRGPCFASAGCTERAYLRESRDPELAEILLR